MFKQRLRRLEARLKQAEKPEKPPSRPLRTAHDAIAHTLAEAADIHMMTVLDLAALVWQCWGVWCCHMESRPGRVGPDPRVEAKELGRRDALETRLHNMVRLNAYVLITHIDGWN